MTSMFDDDSELIQSIPHPRLFPISWSHPLSPVSDPAPHLPVAAAPRHLLLALAQSTITAFASCLCRRRIASRIVSRSPR